MCYRHLNGLDAAACSNVCSMLVNTIRAGGLFGQCVVDNSGVSSLGELYGGCAQLLGHAAVLPVCLVAATWGVGVGCNLGGMQHQCKGFSSDAPLLTHRCTLHLPAVTLLQALAKPSAQQVLAGVIMEEVHGTLVHVGRAIIRALLRLEVRACVHACGWSVNLDAADSHYV